MKNQLKILIGAIPILRVADFRVNAGRVTLKEKRDALIEDLRLIEDPLERFDTLMQRAKRRPALSHELKRDEFNVAGCISNLWLVPSHREGRCYFQSDGDSQITRAVAGMLCDLYSGATPEEVLAEPAEFLSEVGITQHLTQNRRNGLTGVVRQIHAFARACQAG
jgi:cysteine desulfuration protein SufE